jgi:hypothetical protein
LRAQDDRSSWYDMGVSRYRRLPEPARVALLLLPVIVVAALLRLSVDPPGFRHEEASVALAAQQIERGQFPIYFRQGQETVEPAFVYLANVTGQIAGWGVDGPRLAAALLGILAAVGCTLWFHQVLGYVWGLAGGLIVATSFWQVGFGSQAVPSIAMAAGGACGLWALYRATAQRRSRAKQTFPSGWYGLAGLLFGASFYTDITMRAVLPVILLIGAFFFIKKGYLYPAADRRGLLLGAAVMLLVAAPLISYFWQNPESFRLGIDNLTGNGNVLDSLRATVSAIVWSGDGNPAHSYAGRPLLDPILALWAGVGLVVAARRPLDPVHAGVLIWLAGFLIVIVAVAPGNHAQMLALTPVLFFLPIRGMQEVLRIARARGRDTARLALAIITLSLLASASWSMVTTIQWTSAEATYLAFNGDIRDAVVALDDLPNDNLMVYFATGEHGRIVRYLAPDRPRRDFENPDTLPLPASGPAYLIVPASSGMPAPLRFYLGDETLVTTGSGPRNSESYAIWLIDERIRDGLPYAVPGIFFEGGPILVGFEVAPLLDSLAAPAIDVVLVYRVVAGSDAYSAVLRLVEPGGEEEVAGTLVQPAPNHVVTSQELILVRIVLPFPDTPDMIADLHTAIQGTDGEYLRPYGTNVIVYDDVFALLNAIGYIGPQP